MNEVRELSASECAELLRRGVAGRVALSTPTGPHIVPVNYTVVEDAIIMRTSPDSLLAAHGCGVTVAFEVDYVNHTHRRGCSVVARGDTEIVTDPAMVAQIHRVWEPRPWAGGSRPMLLRLRWRELSGRQLGIGWDPMGQRAARGVV